MGRKIRVKLPSLIPESSGMLHDEMKRRQEAVQAKQKTYADNRRKAQDNDFAIGDRVLLRQPSSSTSPPWDPNPFTVVAKSNTRLTAKRGEKTVSRNCQKFKLVKVQLKPDSLKVDNGEIDSDDDWITDCPAGLSTSGIPRDHPKTGRSNNTTAEVLGGQYMAQQRPRRVRRQPDRYSPS